MIRPGEIRKGSGQIEFALSTIPGHLSTGLRPKSPRPAAPASAVRELAFSANQVLVVLISAISLTGLFIWAIVRLWLFEH